MKLAWMISLSVWLKRTEMSPRRGEVWLADLGWPTGHEQAYKHPAVVIQNDDLGQLSTFIVIPTTSKLHRRRYKGTVTLQAGEGGLDKQTVALCYQARVLDRSKLLQRLGEVSSATLAEVEITMAYVLGIAV